MIISDYFYDTSGITDIYDQQCKHLQEKFMTV